MKMWGPNSGKFGRHHIQKVSYVWDYVVDLNFQIW